MNFLLLQPSEVDDDGLATLHGRRALHLSQVLRAERGQRLRCGMLDGMLGEAVVEAITPTTASVRASFTRPAEPVNDVLLLAAPRPKVLLRMLAHAAALGFARVVLFRSWRVDKTWLQSRAFDPDVQREQLLLGLEQAGRTRLPEVLRFDRFKPLVEDALPALALPTQRFVAHPSAHNSTRTLGSLRGPFALALGPDGGFLSYEIEQLQSAGFCPITMGAHAQRTETALAALWGQLDLLRGRATFSQA